MKRFLKWLALALVLVIVAMALTAAWYLRWDELEPPAMPGVVEQGELQHGDRSRTWVTYLPASKKPRPELLIVLHGSQSSGTEIRTGTFYSFDVVAEREGFVVVYPDGVERHWNGCRASASYAANQLNVDDVGFMRALVDEMVARYGVDPGRVFATGFSNGGHMVYRLAYEAPDLLAGAAPVVANLPVSENNGCEPSDMPLPMLIVNGTEDRVNPWVGGPIVIMGDASRGAVHSSEESARYWAELAGYEGAGERTTWPEKSPDDGTSIESIRWSVPGKPPVTLIAVVGGGHTFPNPVYNLPRAMGATSHEVDGAELIWDFFKAL